ncbi:lysophospholipase, partial [Pantoea sp. B_10]
AMAAAGHAVEGTTPYIIQGARHEILFETDAMRAEALNAVVDFYQRHRD